MNVLSQAAGLGAVNPSLSREKRASQQGSFTLDTAKACLRRMPVEAIICHLSMVHTWKGCMDT